jgi:hypothetical protein
MKSRILILLLAFSQFAISQSNTTSTGKVEQTALSEKDFEKLKNDYSAMTKSESYIAMKNNMAEFSTKLNGLTDAPLLSKEEFEKWINNNIAKTLFKNVNEAISIRQLGIDLTSKNQENFSEVYTSLRKASKQQRMNLLKAERNGEFR